MERNDISEMDSGNFTEKPVANCTESDILAADVLNSSGCKLLCVNTVITDYIKIHLKMNNIETIRVYKAIPSEAENIKWHSTVIKSYGDTVSRVKKIITNLSAGKPIHYDEIVKLSDNMIKNMNNCQNSYIVKYTSQLKSADQYTYAHSANVAFYAMLIAKWLGLSEKEISFAVQAGLLHDLGKTKIPSSILRKKGSLTPEEFTVMKSHPLHSYKLIYNCSDMDTQIKEAALLHHERLDGSGYPLGITSMSLLARIIAIADVYDAMTSDRVYKKGVTPFKVFEYFQNEGSSLFDLHVLNIFITNMSALLVGSSVKLTNGDTAKIVFIPQDQPSNPVLCINSEFVKLPAESSGIEIEQIIVE